MCFTLLQQTEKSFIFVLNISNFTRGMHVSSILILNILIGWVDVVLYYFLLADNSGCYTWFLVLWLIKVCEASNVKVIFLKQQW